MYNVIDNHSCVISFNLYNIPHEEMEEQKGSGPKIKIKGQSSDIFQVRLALKPLSLSPNHYDR